MILLTSNILLTLNIIRQGETSLSRMTALVKLASELSMRCEKVPNREPANLSKLSLNYKLEEKEIIIKGLRIIQCLFYNENVSLCCYEISFQLSREKWE